MNATVKINGIQVTASNLPLPDVSTWFAWYYERNLDYNASANTSTDDLQLITDIQQISSIGDSYKSVQTISINTEFAQIYANAEANVQITGISTQSAYGDVTASAFTPVSATVSINGIQTTINLGTINTSVQNDEVFQLSGTPRRYSADQFKSANVKISGIGSKIQAESLIAFGVISISAFANVQSVGIYAEVPTIYAEGILSISEDELILLMAA
jgi:hypothetical protein